MLVVTACFLRNMCPALSPVSPFQPPAHTCSTPCTTDTATTLDSLVGPLASVTSVLLGSPIMSPQLPPTYRFFCCSHQVSCLSGTSDQISDDELRSPRLHGTFPLSLQPMLLIPRLPTVMTSSHSAFLTPCSGFVMVMLRFLSHALVFLAFPSPLLLFALNLPCRMAAVADALLGMVNSDLLLLHLDQILLFL
jgi:hypothetical protein